MGWIVNFFKHRDRRDTLRGMPDALRGNFEFRGNRLVGSVRNKYEVDIFGAQIEILRKGAIIATCSATDRPEHQMCEFSLQADGLFTGAELVKEEVVVIARDKDGNNGRLWLDGVAQLELIRNHLDVPSDRVFDLDFGYDGNAMPFLGDGWSGAEASFTWTENDDSFVHFDAPAAPGTYALRMTAGAVIHGPDLGAAQQ